MAKRKRINTNLQTSKKDIKYYGQKKKDEYQPKNIT